MDIHFHQSSKHEKVMGTGLGLLTQVISKADNLSACHCSGKLQKRTEQKISFRTSDITLQGQSQWPDTGPTKIIRPGM